MSASNIVTLSQNLDPHLVYPILEFLEKQGQNVTDAKKYILSKTSRFADAADQIDPNDQGKMNKIENQQKKFATNYGKALENCKVITDEFFDTVNDEFRLKKLQRELEEERKNGNLAAPELYASKKITQQSISALYELAFLSFDAGFYTQASQMLYLYLAISSKKDGEANEVSAMWGKLVCDSLSGSFDSAMDTVELLRAQQQAPNVVTTVARSWLLHHSLFAYFKRLGATQMFLDHVIDFSTYVYANTIEVHSPHLIRYLAAAAILNRKRRSYLKRVTKIMEQELYNHKDCFADFLLAMGDSDFEAANKHIKAMSSEAEGDYFLSDVKDELVNAAQSMVFEDYLKIHKTVSIPAVAKQLGFEVNKAEVWLVTLIQESKIEAEIDSVKQLITIQTAANAASQRSVHRSVLTKLEAISRPTN